MLESGHHVLVRLEMQCILYFFEMKRLKLCLKQGRREADILCQTVDGNK